MTLARSHFKIGELSYAAFTARNEILTTRDLHKEGKISDEEYKKVITSYCRLRLELVKKRNKGMQKKRKINNKNPYRRRWKSAQNSQP